MNLGPSKSKPLVISTRARSIPHRQTSPFVSKNPSLARSSDETQIRFSLQRKYHRTTPRQVSKVLRCHIQTAASSRGLQYEMYFLQSSIIPTRDDPSMISQRFQQYPLLLPLLQISLASGFQSSPVPDKLKMALAVSIFHTVSIVLAKNLLVTEREVAAERKPLPAALCQSHLIPEPIKSPRRKSRPMPWIGIASD